MGRCFANSSLATWDEGTPPSRLARVKHGSSARVRCVARRVRPAQPDAVAHLVLAWHRWLAPSPRCVAGDLHRCRRADNATTGLFESPGSPADTWLSVVVARRHGGQRVGQRQPTRRPRQLTPRTASTPSFRPEPSVAVKWLGPFRLLHNHRARLLKAVDVRSSTLGNGTLFVAMPLPKLMSAPPTRFGQSF